MLFERDFMEEINPFKSLEESIYFKVGFLMKESKKQRFFSNYMKTSAFYRRGDRTTTYPAVCAQKHQWIYDGLS
jgi:hypothetical protein